MGKINKVMSYAIGICASLVIVYLIYYLISRSVNYVDYSPEYRDATFIRLTEFLAHGVNPFTTEYVNDLSKAPFYIDSCFFNILIATPFVALGFKATSVFLVMNIICHILTMALIGIVIYRITSGRTDLATLGGLISFFVIERGCHIIIRPDSMAAVLGIVFMILSIWYLNSKKTGIFWLMAITEAAMFFCKPHYAAIGGTFLLYLLFFDRKKVFKYIGIMMIVVIVFYVPLFIAFPEYFKIFLISCMYTVSDATTASVSSIAKFYAIAKIFFPIFMVYAIGFICECIRIVKCLVKKDKIFVNNTENNFAYFMNINIIFNVFALLILGKSDGALYWYYYFMLLPSLIVMSLYFLGKIKKEVVGVGVSVLFLALGLFMTGKEIQNKKYDSAAMESMEKGYSILEEYKSDNMLVTYPFAFFSIYNNIDNYDFGDGYVIYDFEKEYFRTHEFDEMNLYTKYGLYTKTMVELVKNSEYSLIALEPKEGSEVIKLLKEFGLEDEFMKYLEENYTLIDTVQMINSFQGPLETSFYIPKAKQN